MGKRIIAQARGKGGPRYRAPSFKFKGQAKHKSLTPHNMGGYVIDIIKCPAHTAPLAVVEYDDAEVSLMIAPEGIRVGQRVNYGLHDTKNYGDIIEIGSLPEGTLIYNIEAKRGDGGKFCRAAGTFGKIVSKTNDKVLVQLPSKKIREFSYKCRANLGVVAGDGRLEKPLYKAGNAYYKYKMKNKLYPKVSGSAVNAIDHPFGNKRSSRKAKAKPVSRHAPPGRKVGLIAARRTGRKRGSSQKR